MLLKIYNKIFKKQNQQDGSQSRDCVEPDEINFITYRLPNSKRIVRTSIKKYKELFNLY